MEFRARFLEWNHGSPTSELLHFDHRMQDEIKAILYWGKNILNLPFGEMGQCHDWAHRTIKAIPPVKKLDCGFDMRDVTKNTSASDQVFKAAQRVDGVGDDFERLSRGVRKRSFCMPRALEAFSMFGRTRSALSLYLISIYFALICAIARAYQDVAGLGKNC